MPKNKINLTLSDDCIKELKVLSKKYKSITGSVEHLTAVFATNENLINTQAEQIKKLYQYLKLLQTHQRSTAQVNNQPYKNDLLDKHILETETFVKWI